MRAVNLATAILVSAAAWVVASAPALGQYYVPLRYDLRYGRPVYIPGREPWTSYGRYDAPPPDPYSFEAVQSRDLIVTGNVRAGRSFRGTTPYSATGGQLAMDLPSLRLSTFHRDSVGVEDLGTGVEYGAPLPYIPPSAAVTTPSTVGTRFGPAYEPPVPVPARPALEGGPTPWQAPALYTYQPPSAPAYPAVPRADFSDRLWVPQATARYLEVLLERMGYEPQMLGLERAVPPDAPAEAARAAVRDLPYEVTFRFESVPENVFDPERRRREAAMEAEPPPSGLAYWRGPRAESEDKPAREGLGEEAGLTLPEEPAAEEEPPWTTLPPGPVRPGDREAVVFTPYGALVREAHAAFRQREYERAARLYRRAIIMQPDRPAAVFGEVHALVARGYYNQAGLALERALHQHPDWIKAPPNPRAVFAEETAYDRIIQDLAAELKQDRHSRRLNFLMGYLLYAGGRGEEARPYLQRSADDVKHLKGPEEVMLEAIGPSPTP